MCFEDTRDALEMRLAPQMSSQMSSLSFADDDKLKRKSEDTSKGKYTRIFPCLCALLDDHLGLRVDERQSDGADPPHGEPGKRALHIAVDCLEVSPVWTGNEETTTRTRMTRLSCPSLSRGN